jgi:hypothetical protein
MPEFEDLYGSRFLTAADLKGPVNAFIERIEEESFTRDGKASRPKAVIYFRGARKPVVCNKTNANVLAHAFGKSFEEWIGKCVTVRPETTTFNGKVVPALRLYPVPATQIGATAPPKPEPKPFRRNERQYPMVNPGPEWVAPVLARQLQG